MKKQLLIGPSLGTLTPEQLEQIVLIGKRDLSDMVTTEQSEGGKKSSLHPKYKFHFSTHDILGEERDERITFYEWHGGQTDNGEEWDVYPCEIRLGWVSDHYGISFPEVEVVRWFLDNGWKWAEDDRAKDGVFIFREPKWNRGQDLVHVKTGGRYAVVEPPVDCKRLEYCNEPFYVYRSYGQETDHVIWHRRQSEMEDGRFVEA